MSQPTAAIELPEIADATVDRIERDALAEIRDDRARRARSARRRRGAWIGASAAAAVIVVAAVIAPSVGRLATNEASGSTTDSSIGSGQDSGSVPSGGGAESAPDAPPDNGLAADAGAQRDIVTTASVSLSVDDVAATAEAVGTLATDAGGWIESMSVGTGGQQPMPIDGMTGMTAQPEGVAADVATADYGWITVRVPADQLNATVTKLGDLGEVSQVSVDRQDVTQQATDLRARVDALKASVTRLTELMSQTASVADLISAETALADRQAELESYQQQLTQLDSQVAMSTLSVNLTRNTVAVTADPAGFADGWAAGWNTLVASLNGVVVALGFLIPWILAIVVIGGIAWFAVRLVRRSRRRADLTAEQSQNPPD